MLKNCKRNKTAAEFKTIRVWDRQDWNVHYNINAAMRCNFNATSRSSRCYNSTSRCYNATWRWYNSTWPSLRRCGGAREMVFGSGIHAWYKSSTRNRRPKFTKVEAALTAETEILYLRNWHCCKYLLYPVKRLNYISFLCMYFMSWYMLGHQLMPADIIWYLLILFDTCLYHLMPADASFYPPKYFITCSDQWL